jgi:hypothetical protein
MPRAAITPGMRRIARKGDELGLTPGFRNLALVLLALRFQWFDNFIKRRLGK